jgi:pimeloyl-ACP methyl ester carboxylesterase
MAHTSHQIPGAAGSLATLPPGFSSGEVQVNGTALHYVRGGDGPVIILLHGFPQDWTEYRSIMPRLAGQFTVVSVDLPGIGRSKSSATGYDTAHMSADIHALAAGLNLDRPYLVGHDLGGLTAYAYLRQFPDDLRGVMILDVPISGLRGTEEASSDFWHIRFIQVPGEFAEKLIVGRQDVFLGWSLAMGAFTPEEREYYTQSYGGPQIHAAFEIYRAFPANGEYNAARTEAIKTPVVVAVGEKSFFAEYLPTFVDAYHEKGVMHVESAAIPEAGHYLLADNPQAVADLIEKYASR